MRWATLLYLALVVVIIVLAATNAVGPIAGAPKVDKEDKEKPTPEPVPIDTIEVPLGVLAEEQPMPAQVYFKLNHQYRTLDEAIDAGHPSGKVSALGLENATVESEDSKTKTKKVTVLNSAKNKKTSIDISCDREVCKYKVTKVEAVKDAKEEKQ